MITLTHHLLSERTVILIVRYLTWRQTYTKSILCHWF